MGNPLHILMVAAENGALPGVRVGGIGDVIRDVPPALAALPERIEVDVVLPSYGFLHAIEGTKKRKTYDVAFGGSIESVELYEVPAEKKIERVRHFVIHRPGMERETVFFGDKVHPFATDATKFARFCAAVAEGLKRQLFGAVTHLHLHDWHAAFLPLLIRYDSSFTTLQGLKTVYTIHNLGLQGIRPFRGHKSSMESWYPHLVRGNMIAETRDPEYHDCLNPSAVAIRYAGRVHVVSPTYRCEILRPSDRKDPDRWFFGGEGLDGDLGNADRAGRLFGILNGCAYDSRAMPARDLPSYNAMIETLYGAVSAWSEKEPNPRHDLALERLHRMRNATHRPATILTFVSRLVNQKARVLRLPNEAPALDMLLAGLGDDDLLIMLATGDAPLEQYAFDESRRFKNFLFLWGFDETAGDALYANGDLFLMPSLYEPCGISQMRAMRDGQPCVVHATGGLIDTVVDGETGFSYGGSDATQTEMFVRAVFRALKLRRDHPEEFDRIRNAAFRKRFLWNDSVRQYVDQLYV